MENPEEKGPVQPDPSEERPWHAGGFFGPWILAGLVPIVIAFVVGGLSDSFPVIRLVIFAVIGAVVVAAAAKWLWEEFL